MYRTTGITAAKTIAAVTALILAVTACAASPGPVPAGSDAGGATPSQARAILADPILADPILADLGLADRGIKDLVDTLDALPVVDRPSGLIASVRPQALVLSTQDGRESSIPMPSDEFYLSIAPYLASTHECHYHSLTTCRGELANTDLDITVRDQATGAVLVEGRHSTFDNGFVGLWLPRGITADVTIDHQGKRASTTVRTGADDDATCLTTMRLT